jgi:hypothetical protein
VKWESGTSLKKLDLKVKFKFSPVRDAQELLEYIGRPLRFGIGT